MVGSGTPQVQATCKTSVAATIRKYTLYGRKNQLS